MKVLINTPHISLLGGVANHYKGLKKYWQGEIVYNYIGARNKVPRLLILVYDYCRFALICHSRKYDLIVLNPSLGKTAIIRDSLFLKIACFLKIKTIIFIHGWDKSIEKSISIKTGNFINKYKNAAAFIVLSSEFKNKLLSWGFKQPIYLLTTKVEDTLVGNWVRTNEPKKFRILFLARIVKEKGILLALRAFHNVHLKFPEAILTVVGDGDYLKEIKRIIANETITNVEVKGALYDLELINAFKTSSIYLFPSYYGEGMPTSVLEAMAFGLPVITRPVGGLIDFFENENMGYLIDSLNPDDFAQKIIYLLENPDKINEIGKYNYRYAQQNFMASKVAKKMESIFRMTVVYESKE
jgi:glycosyltransferase involved in cell wall biosynthesis